MYVKTPKKYRGRQRRGLISWRKIFLWIFTLGFIFAGIGIYENRAVITPIVDQMMSTAVKQVEGGVATAFAPTPTATQDPSGQLVRANNFWDQGSVSEALSIYLDIAPSVPNNAVVYDRITTALIAQGDYQEALEFGEKTVNANPFSSDAWAIRAWSLDWNNRSGDAISSALFALELNPDNVRAQAYLAEAYLSNGLTQRALTTAEQAIENDPDSSEAYRARGLVYWAGFFDRDSALDDFETAYALAPNNTQVATDIAAVQFELGNIEEASNILADVILVNPESPSALYWLSFLSRRTGDPVEAQNYASNCVAYHPEDVDCLYELGRAQYSLEEYSVAAQTFGRVVALGTENPYHYWWAGQSQIDVGNCTIAMRHLETGYRIAQEDGNTTLIGDYDAIIPICSSTGIGGNLNTTVPATSGTAIPTSEPRSTNE